MEAASEPTRRPNTGAGIPITGRFHYSSPELVADGIVHAIGILLAIAAGAALLAMPTVYTGPGEYVAAALFVVALLAALSVSLAYNLWPVSPAKWILRRFDHAAIYFLIAATYTPFLAQLSDTALTRRMLVLVWSAAALGIAVKLLFPGRFDRLAVGFYLAMGWSGVVVLQPMLQTLPSSTLSLIAAGGIVYSCGVIFFAWQSLRFQNAVWHGFVVTGAGLHFAALLDCLVVNRL